MYVYMYISNTKNRELYTRHSILTLYLLYPLVICYIAIETGHENLMNFPINSMVVFHNYVCLTTSNPIDLP